MSANPYWIDSETARALHDGALAIAGGAPGLRDAGLLESALARPQNAFSFGRSDIFDLAALYAMAIARNHPFIDGNKRTGFTVAALFLDLNGYLLRAATGTEHADMMVKLAHGTFSEEAAAQHFKEHCAPHAGPDPKSEPA